MGSNNSKKKVQKIQQSTPSSVVWQRGQLIGEGAYGQVYECLNIETGELLATKFVQIHENPHKEIHRLKQEITMLIELRHKNIVRYITTEVASDYSGVDIIMEFVPGGSVRNLLNKFKRLHEKTVQRYVKQVLEGLAYLHNRGIVHRDIKCANLLLSNDGTIKLSDFGASKRLDYREADLCKSLRGSPYWMAPEVVKRTGHSFPADIWSVGCVVIEMVTGSPPWANFAKDIHKVLRLIKDAKSPPNLPGNLSEYCLDFLINCLQIEPFDRPTAEELLDHPFMTEDIEVKEEDVSDVEYLDVEPHQFELEYNQEEFSSSPLQAPVFSNMDYTVYNYHDIPMTNDKDMAESRFVKKLNMDDNDFKSNRRP